MEALGNNESHNDLTYDYVDCCLGSASIHINFLEMLEDNWKISSSASPKRYKYLKWRFNS